MDFDGGSIIMSERLLSLEISSTHPQNNAMLTKHRNARRTSITGSLVLEVEGDSELC